MAGVTTSMSVAVLYNMMPKFRMLLCASRYIWWDWPLTQLTNDRPSVL